MDKSVNYVEIQAEQVENRNLCKGRKLLYIRGKVEVLLSYIGRNIVVQLSRQKSKVFIMN